MYKSELRSEREYRGFTLQSHDPYGYWTVLDDHDVDYKVPEELSGSYTSDFDIEKAIDGYLASQEVKAKSNTKRVSKPDVDQVASNSIKAA